MVGRILVFILLNAINSSYAQIDQKSRPIDSYRMAFEKFFDFVNEPCELSNLDSRSSGIYRFTYLPSFDIPMTITLVRQQRKVFAVRKQLKLKSRIDYSNAQLSIDTVSLELRGWQLFSHQCIDASMFWYLNENSIDQKLDGARWLIEGLTFQGRKKVYLHSPVKNSSIYSVGLFLSSLFGV